MTSRDDGDPYRERSSVRREGTLLRVPLVAAHLPERCVVCGRRFDLVVRKEVLYRHGRPESTWLLFGLLCTMWIALLYLHPVIVEFWACRAHLRQHRLRLAGRWAAAGALFALAFAAFVLGSRGLGSALALAFAVVAVLAHRASHLVRLARVEGEHAWLVTHRDFVETFPGEATSELSLHPAEESAKTPRP